MSGSGRSCPTGLRPDVIVTQVPYQPGETRDADAVFNAVDDVAVRLSAGRFGVVLGPASVLAGDFPPYSAQERARADLLAGDMVEAVIRLPGGLVPFRPGIRDRAVGADPGPRLPVARAGALGGRLRPRTHPSGDQRPRGGRDHLAARRLRAGRAQPRVSASRSRSAT